MDNISRLKEILGRYSTELISPLLSKVEEMESLEERNSVKEILKNIPFIGECIVLRWDKQSGGYNISPISNFNSIPEWIEYGITTLPARTVCNILNIKIPSGDTPETILWKKGGRSMAGVKALINEAIRKANIQE